MITKTFSSTLSALAFLTACGATLVACSGDAEPEGATADSGEDGTFEGGSDAHADGDAHADSSAEADAIDARDANDAGTDVHDSALETHPDTNDAADGEAATDAPDGDTEIDGAEAEEAASDTDVDSEIDAGADTEADADADAGEADADADADADAGCTGDLDCSAFPVGACQTPKCDLTSGLCVGAPKSDGVPCDDGNACTLGDSCLAGACSPGVGKTCTASDTCHDDGTCNPSTGACSNPAKTDGAPCSDSNACTLGDSCVGGACSPGTAKTCTASDQCHDVGTCDTSTGVCSNPPKTDGSTCSDSNACTVGDTCQSGACSPGTAKTCTASDQCHDAGTCDTSTGACSNPAKGDGTTCDDSNACTVGEACSGGSCSGGSAVSFGTACGTAGAGTVCDGAGACALLQFMVVRVGKTGGTALTSAATSTFVERYDFGGTLQKTITIDDTAFTLSGTSTTEGGLALSTDGHYVTLGGYAAPAGTAAIGGTSTASFVRAVGRVDASDAFTFSSMPTTAFSSNNIRGVTSTDGTTVWSSGANAARYWSGSGADVSLLTSPTTRWIGIFGTSTNQLFASSTGTNEVVTIGTGLPTTTGQTATALPGMPTSGSPSPYQFALFDMNANSFKSTGLDTLYVADDRAIASGGGIQKWTWDDTAATWTLVATYGGVPVRGLAGFKVGGTIYLVATTTETNANHVLALSDNGVSSPVATTIVTAGTNTVYRGLALRPR